MEAYDGPQIVGMALHRRRSVLVRITEDGRKLATARMANSPARLVTEVRRAGLHPEGGAGGLLRLVLGGGRVSGGPRGRCTLAHPLGVKAFSHRRVKNDELIATQAPVPASGPMIAYCAGCRACGRA